MNEVLRSGFTRSTFGDIDSYCEVVSAVDANVTQLEAGDLFVSIEQLDLGDVILSRHGTSKDLFYEGVLDPEWTTLALIRGSSTKETIWCGAALKTDTLFVARSDLPLYIFVPGGWEDYGLVVRTDLLRELTQMDLPRQMSTIDLSPMASALLHGTLAHCVRLAGSGLVSMDDPTQTDALRSVVLSALSGSLANSSVAEDIHTQVRLVSRYHAFSEAIRNVDLKTDPFMTARTLSELAGVGQRRMQRAFSEVVGLSPYQFILRAKLNAARRDLLGGVDATSITRVAANYGFSNASDFAIRYRRFFGESPSETRRRPS